MANNIPLVVGEVVEAVTANTWARGYFRKNTATVVNTTTTATDLLNGEFTLPAGALGTDRILRLTAWGDWKQNVATSKDIPRFQLQLGLVGGGGTGAILIDTGNLGTANAQALATRYGWRIVCEIQNLGATNRQQAWLSGTINYLAFNSTIIANLFTIGNGSVVFGGAPGAGADGVPTTYLGGGTGAVDTTIAREVILNVINANSNAAYETKLLGALVEII